MALHYLFDSFISDDFPMIFALLNDNITNMEYHLMPFMVDVTVDQSVAFHFGYDTDISD